ncbi:MAG TPA: HAD family hydrolase, partial [Micromonosporaceae bacterium]|nr:HAD family hydrolase [Micromonosporaceae bacterium]
DLRGLVETDAAVAVPVVPAGTATVGVAGWAAGRTGRGVSLSGDGPEVAALAALAALAWADGDVPEITADGAPAGAVLRGLRLAG